MIRWICNFHSCCFPYVYDMILCSCPNGWRIVGEVGLLWWCNKDNGCIYLNGDPHYPYLKTIKVVGPGAVEGTSDAVWTVTYIAAGNAGPPESHKQMYIYPSVQSDWCRIESQPRGLCIENIYFFFSWVFSMRFLFTYMSPNLANWVLRSHLKTQFFLA